MNRSHGDNKPLNWQTKPISDPVQKTPIVDICSGSALFENV